MNSPPPKVVYDELPEMPRRVLYDTTLMEDVSTPRRKTRVQKKERRLVVARKRTGVARQEKVNSSAQGPEWIPASEPLAFVDNCDNVPFGEEDDNRNTCTGQEDRLPRDLTYSSFVDVVLSDDCSFYQLTQKVFVANGWDCIKNEATVCVLILGVDRVLA